MRRGNALPKPKSLSEEIITENLMELVKHVHRVSSAPKILSDPPTKLYFPYYIIDKYGCPFFNRIVKHVLGLEKYARNASRDLIEATVIKVIKDMCEKDTPVEDAAKSLKEELDASSVEYTMVYPLEGVILKDIDELRLGDVTIRRYFDEDASRLTGGLTVARRSNEESSIAYEGGKAPMLHLNLADFNAFVRVRSNEKAVHEIGRSRLYEALNLLRFFSLHLTPHEPSTVFIGIRGEEKAGRNCSVALNDDGSFSTSPLEAHNNPIYIGSKEIKNIRRHGFNRLEPLYSKELHELSDFERRIRVATNWVGRAMRQEVEQASFLFFVIATESLLSTSGHDTTDYFVDTITLLFHGTDASVEAKKGFRSRLKEAYGLRSEIVHGVKELIDDADLKFIRKVAIMLVLLLSKKVGKIKTIDQLREYLVAVKLAGGS